MKVKIVYKGGLHEEVFECEKCYPHSYGGWVIVVDESKPQNTVFISSADVRKIIQESDNAKQQA